MAKKSAKRKQEELTMIGMLITGIAGFGAGCIVTRQFPDIAKMFTGAWDSLTSLAGLKK